MELNTGEYNVYGVPKDGNSFFHSIAFNLTHNPELTQYLLDTINSDDCHQLTIELRNVQMECPQPALLQEALRKFACQKLRERIAGGEVVYDDDRTRVTPKNMDKFEKSGEWTTTPLIFSLAMALGTKFTVYVHSKLGKDSVRDIPDSSHASFDIALRLNEEDNHYEPLLPKGHQSMIDEPQQENITNNRIDIFEKLQKALDKGIYNETQLNHIFSSHEIKKAGASAKNQNDITPNHRLGIALTQDFSVDLQGRENTENSTIFDIPGDVPSEEECKSLFPNIDEARVDIDTKYCEGKTLGYFSIRYCELNKRYILEDMTSNKLPVTDYTYKVVGLRDKLGHYYSLTQQPVLSESQTRVTQAHKLALSGLSDFIEDVVFLPHIQTKLKADPQFFLSGLSGAQNLEALKYFLIRVCGLSLEKYEKHPFVSQLNQLLTLSQNGQVKEEKQHEFFKCFVDSFCAKVYEQYQDMDIHKLTLTAYKLKLQGIEDLISALLDDNQDIHYPIIGKLVDKCLQEKEYTGLTDEESFMKFFEGAKALGLNFSQATECKMKISFGEQYFPLFRQKLLDFFTVNIDVTEGRTMHCAITGGFVCHTEELENRITNTLMKKGLSRSQIDTFVFSSGYDLALDHSLTQENYHGSKVCIHSQRNIVVCKDVTIDVSGNHGKTGNASTEKGADAVDHKGEKPKKPERVGKKGKDGRHGGHGGAGGKGGDAEGGDHGGRIFVKAHAIENAHKLRCIANGGDGGNGGSGADGGRGGNGEDGGDGADGKDGEDGTHAKRIIRGATQSIDGCNYRHDTIVGFKARTKAIRYGEGGKPGNAGSHGPGGPPGRFGKGGNKGDIQIRLQKSLEPFLDISLAGAGDDGEEGEGGAQATETLCPGNSGKPGVGGEIEATRGPTEDQRPTEWWVQGTHNVSLFTLTGSGNSGRYAQTKDRIPSDYEIIDVIDYHEQSSCRTYKVAPLVKVWKPSTDPNVKRQKKDDSAEDDKQEDVGSPQEADTYNAEGIANTAIPESINTQEIQELYSKAEDIHGIMEGETDACETERRTLESDVEVWQSIHKLCEMLQSDQRTLHKMIIANRSDQQIPAVDNSVHEASSSNASHVESASQRMIKDSSVSNVYHLLNTLIESPAPMSQEEMNKLFEQMGQNIVAKGNIIDIQILISEAQGQNCSEQTVSSLIKQSEVIEHTITDESQVTEVFDSVYMSGNKNFVLGDNILPAHFTGADSEKELLDYERKRESLTSASAMEPVPQLLLDQVGLYDDSEEGDKESVDSLEETLKHLVVFGFEEAEINQQILPAMTLFASCNSSAPLHLLLHAIKQLEKICPSVERKHVILDNIVAFCLNWSSFTYEDEAIERFEELPLGAWHLPLHLDHCKRKLEARKIVIAIEEDESETLLQLTAQFFDLKRQIRDHPCHEGDLSQLSDDDQDEYQSLLDNLALLEQELAILEGPEQDVAHKTLQCTERLEQIEDVITFIHEHPATNVGVIRRLLRRCNRILQWCCGCCGCCCGSTLTVDVKVRYDKMTRDLTSIENETQDTENDSSLSRDIDIDSDEFLSILYPIVILTQEAQNRSSLDELLDWVAMCSNPQVACEGLQFLLRMGLSRVRDKNCWKIFFELGDKWEERIENILFPDGDNDSRKADDLIDAIVQHDITTEQGIKDRLHEHVPMVRTLLNRRKMADNHEGVIHRKGKSRQTKTSDQERDKNDSLRKTISRRSTCKVTFDPGDAWENCKETIRNREIGIITEQEMYQQITSHAIGGIVSVFGGVTSFLGILPTEAKPHNAILTKKRYDRRPNISVRKEVDFTEGSQQDMYTKGKKFVQERDFVALTAFLCGGIRKALGVDPYDTQVIALLEFLYSMDTGKGLVGQIGTGEGKSIITNLVVMANVLNGRNVNVVTSTPALAVRDAGEGELFYALFGMKVSNNCDAIAQENYEILEKRYNECAVMYGQASDFERDRLLTEAKGMNLASDNNRPYPETCLYIDEVDHTLVDNGGFNLFLSDEVTDFRLMEIFIKDLWCGICLKHKEFQGQVQEDEDANNEARLEGMMDEILDNFLPKIHTNEYRLTKILQEYTERSLQTWIKSGFMALSLTEGREYFIKATKGDSGYEDVIVMDTTSGVEQKSTQWMEMLHQFIQLKHNLHITYPTVMSVYESNMTFVEAFSGRVYGVTGTLGNAGTRSLLADLGNVDTFELPHLKEKRLKEMKEWIVSDKNEWKECIGQRIKERNGEQPILVIVEDMITVKEISEYLTEQGMPPTLSIDTNEKMEKCTSQLNTVKRGEIFIATNIAGRGTDIKFDESSFPEKGLHVIMAHLADNDREEKQAIGRAGRKGMPGSCEHIVICEDGYPMAILKYQRDLEELCGNENIRTKDVPKNQFLNKLYKTFLEQKREVESKLARYCSGDGVNVEIRAIHLKEFQCRWGFFLSHAMQLFDDDETFSSFTANKEAAIEQKAERELKIISSECLQFANDMRGQKDKVCFVSTKMQICTALLKDNKHAQAKRLFQDVAESDTDFEAYAAYYVGICTLFEGQLVDTRIRARRQIKKALRLLHNLLGRVSKSEMISSQVAEMMHFHGARETSVKEGDDIVFMHGALQDQRKREALEVLSSHIKTLIGDSIELNDITHLGMDSNEAQRVLNSLENKEVIRPIRWSRKITKPSKKGELLIDKRPVKLPNLCTDSQKRLVNMMRTTVNDTTRKISKADIRKCIVETQESAWQKMWKGGMFEGKDHYTVHVNDLSDKAFNGYSESCKKKCSMFLEGNADFIKENFYNAMEGESSTGLLDLLQLQGLLSMYAIAKKSNKALIDFCEKAIHTKIPEEGLKEVEGKTHFYQNYLPLPESVDKTCDELWASLLRQGVIKNHTLAVSLVRDSEPFKKLDDKISKAKDFFSKDSSLQQYQASLSALIDGKRGHMRDFEKFVINHETLGELITKQRNVISKKDNDEVLGLATMGMSIIYDLEKAPEPPWAAIGALLLGLAQIVAGAIILAALSATGVGAVAGSMFARALISEGVSDIGMGVTGLISGNFTWKDYRRQKVESLIVTGAFLVLGGVGKGLACLNRARKAKKIHGNAKLAIRAAKEAKRCGKVKEAQQLFKSSKQMKSGANALFKQGRSRAMHAATNVVGMNAKEAMCHIGKYVVKKAASAAVMAGLEEFLNWLMKCLMEEIIAEMTRQCKAKLENEQQSSLGPHIDSMDNTFGKLFDACKNTDEATKYLETFLSNLRSQFLQKNQFFQNDLVNGLIGNVSGGISNLADMHKHSGGSESKVKTIAKVAEKVRLILSAVSFAKVAHDLPKKCKEQIEKRMAHLVQSEQNITDNEKRAKFIYQAKCLYKSFLTTETMKAFEEIVVRPLVSNAMHKVVGEVKGRASQAVDKMRCNARLKKLQSGNKMFGNAELKTALNPKSEFSKLLAKKGVAILKDESGAVQVNKGYMKESEIQGMNSNMGILIKDKHAVPCIKVGDKWQKIDLPVGAKNACIPQSLFFLAALKKSIGSKQVPDASKLKEIKQRVCDPCALSTFRNGLVSTLKNDAVYHQAFKNSDMRRWRSDAQAGVNSSLSTKRSKLKYTTKGRGLQDFPKSYKNKYNERAVEMGKDGRVAPDGKMAPGFARCHTNSSQTICKMMRTELRGTTPDEARRKIIKKAESVMQDVRDRNAASQHSRSHYMQMEKWQNAHRDNHEISRADVKTGSDALVNLMYINPANIAIGQSRHNSQLGSKFKHSAKTLKSNFADGTTSTPRDYKHYISNAIDFPRDISIPGKNTAIGDFVKAWGRTPGKYIPTNFYNHHDRSLHNKAYSTLNTVQQQSVVDHIRNTIPMSSSDCSSSTCTRSHYVFKPPSPQLHPRP